MNNEYQQAIKKAQNLSNESLEIIWRALNNLDLREQYAPGMTEDGLE